MVEDASDKEAIVDRGLDLGDADNRVWDDGEEIMENDYMLIKVLSQYDRGELNDSELSMILRIEGWGGSHKI